MTATTTKAKTSDTKFIDYPITIGVRIRLTEDQKREIKSRFDELANGEFTPDRQGTGGVSVTTAASPRKLIYDMGCDRMTLASLLGSNERMHIGQLKRWEEVLGIQIVDKKELEDTWKSYLKYIRV